VVLAELLPQPVIVRIVCRVSKTFAVKQLSLTRGVGSH
jgi:hypothetical protein